MSAVTQVAPVGARLRLPKVPPLTALAGVFLVVVAACALFPGFAPQDPAAINAAESLQGPSGAHPLGTDQLGRDTLSRLVAGARTSLLGPLVLGLGVTAISTVLAVAAGWFGGRTDAVISRIIDFFYSVPALLVAIVVAGVTGGGFGITLVVLIIFGLPMHVRNLRAAVMERAHLPFMEAAVTLGLPTWRVVLTHLVPTIVPNVVAVFFVTFTYGVVELSSLSFLGLGVPPGAPDWGRMVADNRAAVFTDVWAVAAPAVAIVLLAVSANLIGEHVQRTHEQSRKER
ncbi:peptide/nickel transport system permease protein/glutathione transport system permease protein [Pseudonocardia thermophila]|uniref:Peptide/nickel transport system permease protein/glutathione transport system permease protein n=1 Tax=Pseudonocardia thermophila TaxID=1848 RepID=A0A1M6T418_PSETH|nr:ABC transporter permease [Pseudonocardia thermophila]SHK51735.1 peptide/nickel transport system permease protein/glutathione transport system permease protein [Pseudonocardia thermophila]